MSPKERVQVIAKYVDGWTARAIAEALGVSIDEVEAELPGGAPARVEVAATATPAAAPRPSADEPATVTPDTTAHVYDDNSVSVRLPHVRVGL